MKIQMLSLLILLLRMYQAQVLDTVTSSPGSECTENRQCATRSSCPYWIEKDIKLKLLRNSDEKRELIEEYKSAICNRSKKGLCCPIESPLDLVEATDKSCPTQSKCATRDSCQFWRDKSDLLRQLRRGTTKYSKLKDEIVSAICNKQRKALCCPINASKEEPNIPTINDSPSYLPTEGECGINPHKTPSSVFGGKTTEPGDYPFAALLGQTVIRKSQFISGGTRAPPRAQPSWVCGGTLINYWYVVTAAHCVGRGPRSITHLRLGEWTVGNFGSRDSGDLPPLQEFSITPNDIIVHKEYKKKFKNIENDIALIRLPRKAVLNAGVQFACLPLPGAAKIAGVRNWDAGVSGRQATVIGWGYSCYKNNTRDFCADSFVGKKDQQYLQVPVLGNQACKDQSLTMTPDQVCAGGEKGKGSCKGDSGGGLFIRKTSAGEKGQGNDKENKEVRPWFLLGIVSYGKPTCGVGTPEVYTRVSKYVSWIRQNIKN